MQTLQLFESSSLETGLKKTCSHYRDNIAVSFGEQEVTYNKLMEEVQAFKTWLNSILGKKTVLIRTNSNLNNVSLILGSILAQSVPLFCDPVWKENELIKALELNNCNYLIGEESISLPTIELKEIDVFSGFRLYIVTALPDRRTTDNLLPDTSFCRFTSGSTGFSRCLQFSEKAFMNAGSNWWNAARYQSGERIYCLATLNNGLAFNTSLLATFFSGAHLILHKGSLVPSVMRKTFERYQPDVFVAFPFIYEMLLNNEKITRDIFKVKLAISSAAPLTDKINEAFQQKFLTVICNYYGLAEVGPCTFNQGDIYSVGMPLLNTEIKINADGQVLVKTNSSASAFLDTLGERLEDSFTEDGFYITKDIGEINELGRLSLKGRVGRMINIQGRKIDPIEIENLLLSDKHIQQAMVIPQEQNGRTVLAAYIEAAEITKEDIMKLCANNLAPYKIPQQVVIVKNLPRSSSGKISIGTLETEVI